MQFSFCPRSDLYCIAHPQQYCDIPSREGLHYLQTVQQLLLYLNTARLQWTFINFFQVFNIKVFVQFFKLFSPTAYTRWWQYNTIKFQVKNANGSKVTLQSAIGKRRKTDES